MDVVSATIKIKMRIRTQLNASVHVNEAYKPASNHREPSRKTAPPASGFVFGPPDLHLLMEPCDVFFSQFICSTVFYVQSVPFKFVFTTFVCAFSCHFFILVRTWLTFLYLLISGSYLFSVCVFTLPLHAFYCCNVLALWAYLSIHWEKINAFTRTSNETLLEAVCV